MLKSLSIQNYALIEELQVSFTKGLITITGETGAGKSLLLGALGLLLGKRADLSSSKDAQKKCIIEGVFNIEKYQLKPLFEAEDLDYEAETIIRREILPSGKSRAFINDTPVILTTLSKIGNYLIDIHSQHQTLEVTTDQFQFEVLDALAQSTAEVLHYKKELSELRKQERTIEKLKNDQSGFMKELEYNSFLLQELENAQLKADELEELEERYETLSNVEEIQERLSYAIAKISTDETGILDQLNEVRSGLSALQSYKDSFKELYERVQSVFVELEDIYGSLENESEKVEADPQQLEYSSQRLNLIHDLRQKHNASNIDELLQIQEELSEKVDQTTSLSDRIEALEKQVQKSRKLLDEQAATIHQKRKKALPILVDKMEAILLDLGMPNAKFKTSLIEKEEYFVNGKDELEFLFSANKGSAFGTLKKVASGGELSRIMLAIKTILSDFKQLPTIIFDEIDTGVSGEVAQKMADLMLQMSQNLQVFSITHLPQIAANGETQYKVFKEDIKNTTVTQLKELDAEGRIKEIAEMIGGKDMSDSALKHAASLLERVSGF